VPNVGVEWFANEHWSVAANVMYIWMKNDMRHRY
jgi:outer membrane protein W